MIILNAAMAAGFSVVIWLFLDWAIFHQPRAPMEYILEFLIMYTGAFAALALFK